MKLYAPSYYKDFVCIADKCQHSCCIGWEIDIDDESARKYATLDTDYGQCINSSIDFDDIPHFRLGDDERCPHLADSGLCNIICELGEDFLCDICREHPRFYNNTPRGQEVGLGMACEEACRIILSSDEYDNIIAIGESDGECDYDGFDTSGYRQRLFSILSDKALKYPQKLKLIYTEFGISADIISDSEWRDIISSLEYLNIEHKEVFLQYTSKTQEIPELEKTLERALAYFIYRHCSSAADYDDFILSLGFCLFCERLLCSVAVSNNISCSYYIREYARIISEEIEYSEDNTEAVKFELSMRI